MSLDGVITNVRNVLEQKGVLVRIRVSDMAEVGKHSLLLSLSSPKP